MAPRPWMAELQHVWFARLGPADWYAVNETVDDALPLTIDYPVLEWPRKIVSFNLDKSPMVEGTLMGLKGQYLILDTGVINLRKFTGYEIQVA